MIKVIVPNVALQVLDWAIQAHGAGGVTSDFPLARLWAGQRTLRIADGPDEVHRNAIAKLELASTPAKSGRDVRDADHARLTANACTDAASRARNLVRGDDASPHKHFNGRAAPAWMRRASMRRRRVGNEIPAGGARWCLLFALAWPLALLVAVLLPLLWLLSLPFRFLGVAVEALFAFVRRCCSCPPDARTPG